MIIIGTEKICVSFGEKIVLSDVSFAANQGDKIAIVGVNGAGKSTLMRALYDQSHVTSGQVYLAKGKSIGHLDQQLQIDPSQSVMEAALNTFSEVREIEQRLEECTLLLSKDHSEEQIRRYTALQQEFEKASGYEYKSRAKGTLIGMGFSEEQLSLPIAALSGGQRTILHLALLLLREPDLLLLDEPTNHLDIRALEWLEERLKRIRSTVIIISHDRLFLDRVTTKTLEIENTKGKLYHVSFTKYREQKQTEREIQERHYQNQQKEIARIEAFIEQQKRWNREKNIIAAESRQKALDRMTKVERPDALPEAIRFQFEKTLESGEDVLSVKGLSKAYDASPLFQSLSFEVKKNDRLLIIGANGSGKSTLLQIITDKILPDDGVYHFGYNVRIGYYDQYQRLNENNTVLEELWQDTDATQTQIRSLLASFYFRGDDVFKEVRVLSGGERARLVLAKLMQKKINLLILDEPTNHLDIESREALENALLGFHGTIIAVSHDRYFIQKIATRLLDFKGDGIVFPYQGGYEDYCRYLSTFTKESTVTRIDPKETEKNNLWEENKKKKQEDRKKKARILKIQDEIEKAESRICEIDVECGGITTDYLRLQELYTEKSKLQALCDSLLDEWTNLEE